MAGGLLRELFAEMQVVLGTPHLELYPGLGILGNREIEEISHILCFGKRLPARKYPPPPTPRDLDKPQMPPLSVYDKARHRPPNSHSWPHK